MKHAPAITMIGLALTAGGWIAAATLLAQPPAEPAAPAEAQAPAQPEAQPAAQGKPVKALLILGGGFHDYNAQKDILKQGIEARANVEVTIAYDPNTSTTAENPVFASESWGAGYDVIIHDECTADIRDLDFIQRVLLPHKYGVPAVVLHCAMHSYRSQGWNQVTFPEATPWFELTGLATTGHGPQLPIQVIYTDDTPELTKGLEDWTSGNEELYNNFTGALQPTAKPIARGRQAAGGGRRGGGRGGRGGRGRRGADAPEAAPAEPAQENTALVQDPQEEAQPAPPQNFTETIVAWTNMYQDRTRVFGTTLGHNTFTVADPRYLDLVTRGMLWAAGRDVDAEFHDSDPAVDEAIRALSMVQLEDGTVGYLESTCCGAGEEEAVSHPTDDFTHRHDDATSATSASATGGPNS